MVDVKKYQAPSLTEAMRKAKQELGRDAVILHTRTYTRGGFMGFFGKQVCEVTASSDVNVLMRAARSASPKAESPARPAPSREQRITRRLRDAYTGGPEDGAPDAAADPGAETRPVSRMIPEFAAGGREGGASTAVHTATPAAPAASPKVGTLHDEMGHIKAMLHDLLKQSRTGSVASMPESLKDVYLMLLERDVSAGIAESLVKRLNENLAGDAMQDRKLIEDKLRGYMADMIPTIGPIRIDNDKCYTVAFIGPTGVGKTTTIAKLAAHLTLREGRSVALVTQDTYRLAAVEQLRTYAKLLNVPLHVVNTPSQMTETIRYLGSKDYILIDTAGRSQGNDMQMKELQLFMEAAAPDEVHLVLSATTQEKNLLHVREKFSIFNPNRLILTKLDEAVELGLVLNVMSQVNAQLSYVTYGQEVPDDFEVGCPRKITEMILRERKL